MTILHRRSIVGSVLFAMHTDGDVFASASALLHLADGDRIVQDAGNDLGIAGCISLHLLMDGLRSGFQDTACHRSTCSICIHAVCHSGDIV